MRWEVKVAKEAEVRPDIEELLKLARKSGKADRELIQLFETLPRNAAFQAYLGLLNRMIEMRGGEILAPAGSIDGVLKGEHVKGSMFGLILARDLVPTMLEQMKRFALAEGDSDDSGT